MTAVSRGHKVHTHLVLLTLLGSAFVMCRVFAQELSVAQQTGEPSLPELRDELADRVARDQEMRKKMIEAMNASGHSGEVSPDNPIQLDTNLIMQLHAVDAENTKWVKQQVDEHGWLGASLVGRDGAHNAWLLVQHADADPKFQQRCLDLMNEMPEGEVDPTDLAYLTDRVLVAAGKPQRYGTQAVMDDGRAVVKNVEDEANLDERRAKLGLPPISEYLQLIEESYGAGASQDASEDGSTDDGDGS